MKTIFNTYIEVNEQSQVDRLKQICIDNDLPIWDSEIAFCFKGNINTFCYSNSIGQEGDFALYPILYGKTEVTESEWLELLKQHQCTK